MKKTLIYILLFVIGVSAIIAIIRLKKTNSKAEKTYETEQLQKINITNKVVATGKVIPLEEVDIKPQISGIIEKVYLEEGAKVKKGDLIATIRVVPNEQSLTSALGRIKNVKVSLENTKRVYERNKTLLAKGVISQATFENSELSYNRSQQDLKNAQNDYQIIKKGSIGGGGANTNIRATTSGTVLLIPVEEGDQVIQSNNFNAGTTIASVADMSKMIFEGKVDEAEVGKLRLGMPLDITIGAIEDSKLSASLNFIAPKGKEESGAIQFTVKGDLDLTNIKETVRAGYSANAAIIIEKKDSVLTIREALLQFDKETKKPFVEVLINKEEGKYEKRDVKLGVSDGINVEIVSGITEEDKIKVWNIESKNEREKEEDN